MGQDAFVSGGGAVRLIADGGKRKATSVPLEGAGALCISGRHVFCACGSAIVRMNRSDLAVQAIFGGGPGVSALLCTDDGAELYALCGDADSVLRIDGRTGAPMLLNRAGVNPRQMTLFGDVLTVAGGESGEVVLLNRETLRTVGRLSMPGPVYSVAVGAGRLYALCLTASLDAMLVIIQDGRECRRIALEGMPSSLLFHRGMLLAATQGRLYAIHPDGACAARPAPGRASWLGSAGKRLLLLDAYSEGLFMQEEAGWRLLCLDACCAAADGA